MEREQTGCLRRSHLPALSRQKSRSPGGIGVTADTSPRARTNVSAPTWPREAQPGPDLPARPRALFIPVVLTMAFARPSGLAEAPRVYLWDREENLLDECRRDTGGPGLAGTAALGAPGGRSLAKSRWRAHLPLTPDSAPGRLAFLPALRPLPASLASYLLPSTFTRESFLTHR